MEEAQGGPHELLGGSCPSARRASAHAKVIQRGAAFDAAGGRHPILVQHCELRALSSGEAFDGVE